MMNRDVKSFLNLIPVYTSTIKMETEMQKLLEQVAAHLNIKISEIKVEPIQHGSLQKHNVFRLRIGTDSFLLKQHDITVPVPQTSFTPFQIERHTISILHNDGLCVPRIIWNSEQQNALLLEWCGNQTLDSLAQRRSKPNLDPLLNIILSELNRFEAFFAKHSTQFQPFVFHFDHKKNLKHLLKQGRKTISYLEHLRKPQHIETQRQQIDAAWTSLSNRLLEAIPTLDSLDYQAHNIVIDGELPTFIDFGSIGWDWQERRLVQYFNSIGAHQEGANFVSLLNRELVETYAEWVVKHRGNAKVADVSARVDAHHLLFYLTIVHRILEAVARPETTENHTFIHAWGDMRSRFQRAILIINDTNLSNDVDTNLIRELIREFQTVVS